MGITFDIGSIVPPENNPYPNELPEIDWSIVHHIEKAFNWETVPCQEPSEIKGEINSSANYSRYALLLKVASEATGLVDQRIISKSIHINEIIKDTTFINLLDCDRHWSIYIPIDFPQPSHFKDEKLWTGAETFTVCSSIKLAEELKVLELLIKANIEIFGAETVADPETLKTPSAAKHKWSGVYDLCSIFLEGAEESQKLNLPFHIRY